MRIGIWQLSHDSERKGLRLDTSSCRPPIEQRLHRYPSPRLYTTDPEVLEIAVVEAEESKIFVCILKNILCLS